MTIKQFFKSKEKLAIHCKNEKQAKILLKAFDNEGYAWVSGARYTDKIRWNNYKEETCYDNKRLYDNREFYKNNDYTIIEFEDIDI